MIWRTWLAQFSDISHSQLLIDDVIPIWLLAPWHFLACSLLSKQYEIADMHFPFWVMLNLQTRLQFSCLRNNMENIQPHFLHMLLKAVVDLNLCIFLYSVWQKLEEENAEFFRAYYIRLMLKKQILLFNNLLEHQYHLVNHPATPKAPLATVQNGIHLMTGNFSHVICFTGAYIITQPHC